MSDEPQEPSSEQMQEEFRERVEMLEKAVGAYPTQTMPGGSLGINRAATVRQQMVQQMRELEARANEIRNLVKLFDESPNVEKILNSMRKLGF